MSLSQSTSSRIGDWFANYLSSSGEPIDVPSVAPEAQVTSGLLDPAKPTAPTPPSTTLPLEPVPTAPAPTASGANPAARPTDVNITGTTTAAPAPQVAPAPTTTAAPTTPTPAPSAPVAATATAQTTPSGLLQSAPAPAGSVTTLNLDELSRRTLDPASETVEGRLEALLDKDSPYIAGARERTARAANARGLLNSSIAASAGEEAATRSAFDIANADAAAYQKAGDYNTAVENQGRMYNADAFNKMSLEQLQAANQQAIAASNAASSAANAAASAAASRYNAELNAASQRYGTDEAGRRQAEQLAAQRYESEQARIAAESRQSTELHAQQVNNILMNGDIPPEVRARLLRELGENGLADAIYIASGADEGGTPTSDYGGGVNASDSGGV